MKFMAFIVKGAFLAEKLIFQVDVGTYPSKFR
jgi:hypothetical protein